jgi:3-phosphoshikimate 1-carboxyvinyltransferase
MTLQCLRERGVRAEQTGVASWSVAPGEIQGARIQIEPDLSNAGPFLAAAMVSGGRVEIPNWPESTTQVGAMYVELLNQMGGSLTLSGGSLIASGDGTVHGINADLAAAGELTPTIAALAALADSPSRLTGIGHLRGHETDRLRALVAEINNLGGNATELEDGIEILPAELHGGLWHTYEDHRMATAGAIIGLRVPGVEVEDISVTSKTMPEFDSMWRDLVGKS